MTRFVSSKRWNMAKQTAVATATAVAEKPYSRHNGLLIDPSFKRTKVFGKAFFDFDLESGMGRDFEKASGGVRFPGGLPFKPDLTGACQHIHPFRGIRVEGKGPRIDESDRFLRPITQEQRVTDHLAIKLDVGFQRYFHILDHILDLRHIVLLF